MAFQFIKRLRRLSWRALPVSEVNGSDRYQRECRFVALAAVIMTVIAATGSAQCPAPPGLARLEVTTIPLMGAGGSDETDIIRGVVKGTDAEEARIVVYSHAGDRWWCSRWPVNPYTSIADEGWEARIHLGFEYAVLLVHRSYRPESQIFSLPALGNCVWAQVTVPGRLSQTDAVPETRRDTSRIINFSGYDWTIKAGVAGPGPNLFSDAEENVHVDTEGRLHLRISYRDGKWFCAEVVTNKSLGHGTY